MPKTLCQSFHRIAIGAAFAERQPQFLAVQAAQRCSRHRSRGSIAGSAKTALHSPRFAIGYRILCTAIRTDPVFSSAQFNRHNRGFTRRVTGQSLTDLYCPRLSISDSQAKKAFQSKMRSFLYFRQNITYQYMSTTRGQYMVKIEP